MEKQQIPITEDFLNKMWKKMWLGWEYPKGLREVDANDTSNRQQTKLRKLTSNAQTRTRKISAAKLDFAFFGHI